MYPKIKKQTYAQLKKKLDTVHSLWIRKKDLDKNGLATCVTCGKKALPAEMQCGHYISRTYIGTRWNDKNTAVQCVSCNVFLKGNIAQFAFYLMTKFGAEVFQELQFLKETPIKFSATDLEWMIEIYKKKLKNL